eukprot:GFUD01034606.1.p1 GENE.GFUD01034606.1~~GFUD01034606.1.p1  ORF type:complete len:328 (-),score=99.21 GFUD01034606.1:23-961(-)
MAVTTTATIMGVIILRIHHKGQRGNSVPPKLRAFARILAILTWSNYPDTEEHLKELEKGVYQAEVKDSYQYNIKSYQNRVQTKTKPANSMRKMSCDFQPNGIPSKFEECGLKSEENRFRFVKSQISYFKDRFKIKSKPKVKDDCDLSFNEEEEDREVKKEVRNRWKKGFGKVVEDVKRKNNVDDSWAKLIHKVLEESNKGERMESEEPKQGLLEEEEKVFWSEMDKMCRKVVEDSWRKFMSEIWEDRWRAEDRKEIIGEEWRKISRILDRSLLILLLLLSLVNTIWCIFASPYLNRNKYETEGDGDLLMMDS